MINSSSYITSPIVTAGLRNRANTPRTNSTTSVKESQKSAQKSHAVKPIFLDSEAQSPIVDDYFESEYEDPEWLKAKRRELARRYANISNKNSPYAENIMATLKRLIQFRVSSRATPSNRTYSRFSATPYRRHSSCPRCSGFGMGQFRHVQNGVCFCCGKLP